MVSYVSDCGTNPLKPNYTTLKSTRNYIKYTGLKKHGRQKPNLTRHQCEICDKTFKNEMMMDFHKRTHHHELPAKDCEDNFNDRVNQNTGNNLLHNSKSRNKIQFQQHIQQQTGEKRVGIFLGFNYFYCSSLKH